MQAVKLDPQFAEAHFRLAQCELALTNADTAAQFQMACDDDALPFRADTRINAAIRQVAQQDAGDRLALCDAEQALAQASPAGIAGDETLFEHVHFNFDGNFRLGKFWAEQIGQMLSATAMPRLRPRTGCRRKPATGALGLTIWNRQFVLHAMIRRLGTPRSTRSPITTPGSGRCALKNRTSSSCRPNPAPSSACGRNLPPRWSAHRRIIIFMKGWRISLKQSRTRRGPLGPIERRSN